MEYIFTFLEGIASFISPCILPMLPIYISYFVGKEENKTSKAVINSIGFVIRIYNSILNFINICKPAWEH